MSCVEICAFDKKGNAYCYGEVKNSFRGAMAVWHMLEERHLPPFIPESVKEYSWYQPEMTPEEMQERAGYHFSRILCSSEKGLKAIWDLADNPEITFHERIVLFTTLDDCLVKKEDIERVIEAFEQFGGDTNLPEQAEILRKIAEDDNVIAVGWSQNSVSCEGWDAAGGYDEETEECLPYNCLTGTKHYWLFDELKA